MTTTYDTSTQVGSKVYDYMYCSVNGRTPRYDKTYNGKVMEKVYSICQWHTGTHTHSSQLFENLDLRKNI